MARRASGVKAGSVWWVTRGGEAQIDPAFAASAGLQNRRSTHGWLALPDTVLPAVAGVLRPVGSGRYENTPRRLILGPAKSGGKTEKIDFSIAVTAILLREESMEASVSFVAPTVPSFRTSNSTVTWPA